MNYPGKELELFDKANFWRKNIFILKQINLLEEIY